MKLRYAKAAGLLLGVVACAGQAAGFADNPAAEHVRNFGQVSERLYRGGQPDQRALEELAARQVKLVIDLREPSEGTRHEQQIVEALKMKYINIPFREFGAPTEDQMRRVLWLLVNGDTQKIFVHCWRGKDRTGTVVACYRIQHDGWDNKKALAEAHKYGMSFTERGMRSYILHFSPISLSVLSPAGN
ncbi:MAG: tyrosine-protein phosphatase [Acidobacteriaceae bacterium]|nr:tyrosine-protein phosphatase [Acidobacteriaceae bacterium]